MAPLGTYNLVVQFHTSLFPPFLFPLPFLFTRGLIAPFAALGTYNQYTLVLISLSPFLFPLPFLLTRGLMVPFAALIQALTT